MRSLTFIEPFWPGLTRKPWAVRTIALLLPTWPKATAPRPWPAPKKLSPGVIGKLVILARACSVDNESLIRVRIRAAELRIRSRFPESMSKIQTPHEAVRHTLPKTVYFFYGQETTILI